MLKAGLIIQQEKNQNDFKTGIVIVRIVDAPLFFVPRGPGILEFCIELKLVIQPPHLLLLPEPIEEIMIHCSKIILWILHLRPNSSLDSVGPVSISNCHQSLIKEPFPQHALFCPQKPLSLLYPNIMIEFQDLQGPGRFGSGRRGQVPVYSCLLGWPERELGLHSA